MVREYAVEVLRKASEEELKMYLSQLVQALRYDQAMLDIAATGSNNMNMDKEQAGNDVSHGKPIPTAAEGGNTAVSYKFSSLANFLIERCCGSLSLANYLYWFLKVETDLYAELYSSVLVAFITRLKQSHEGEVIATQLLVRRSLSLVRVVYATP